MNIIEIRSDKIYKKIMDAPINKKIYTDMN